ncbi:ArsR/SmtB family transcription factor [Microlunatus speluncae]|uniref:ArsR/SmtB family transcription factor n=1 Tax=Microlunatus speluncae TaxID=2594267 RepID=UPI00126669F5|nr:helix-turn-helix domain-containing protein [Microlunatus speluncae]
MPRNIQLDSAAIRVLAHPLRSRLLSALRLHGPATATELAERLGTNTGATSYHLRKLESVGLVEDTDEGEGKRRVWRASSEYHSWQASDFAGDEDAETSLAWLTRDYVRHAAELMQRWFDAEHGWSAEWRDALGISDDILVLTPAQTRALHEELDEVIQRYKRSPVEDPKARQISIWQLMHPTDPDQP